MAGCFLVDIADIHIFCAIILSKRRYMSKQAVTSNYNMIADYFIALSNETGSLITNLKLQKLVYYAQAWSLALNNKALFDDDFQAWVHGPVLPALYKRYSSFRWNPICKDISLDKAKEHLNQEIVQLLEEVSSVYFELDAYKLERLTHAEEPWIKARGSLAVNEPCQQCIDKETMRQFYSRLSSEI